MKRKLLEIENLSVNFHTPEGIVGAVDQVSFDVAPGETLGLVGESGCGKSVTSLSVLGLIASPPGEIKSGRIVFENQNLLALDTEKMRRIRGRDISMIFQDSSGSLWFAGWEGGGVTRYDGKTFHTYREDDGLVDDRVVCMVEDDKGNLWIGTSAGVSCYDGKIFRNSNFFPII